LRAYTCLQFGGFDEGSYIVMLLLLMLMKLPKRQAKATRSSPLGYSEDEIKDAGNAQALIRKKLLEIMDLQADIDGLLRDVHPTPFGSVKWKDARPEVLQRAVLMAAIQFVLFEPDDWVNGNSKFKAVANEMLEHLVNQCKWIKEKYK
jgi:hypothetical protein